MATVEQVEQALADLLARLDDVDEDTRVLLPTRRTLEARCPDLDLVRYAEWRSGTLHLVDGPHARPADIRISVRSDDLLRMTNGELGFSRAYASNRVRLDASMADLLRLRAVL